MKRIQITDKQINDILEKTRKKLYFRLKEKGYGTFSSKHEILGVLTEEYNEFINAVHNKDYDNMKEELLDLAIGAIFGLSCLDNNTIDW